MKQQEHDEAMRRFLIETTGQGARSWRREKVKPKVNLYPLAIALYIVLLIVIVTIAEYTYAH